MPFEISSVDSAWHSGIIALKNKSLVTVPMYKRGENKFVVEVFDRGGDSVFIYNNTIVIMQTFANVGALKISGEDFEFGTIVEGSEIICNYTIDDAGSINLAIDIPAVGEEFYKNFYSREDAQIDFNKDTSKLNRDGKNLLDRVRELGRAIKSDDDYEKLQRAGEVASAAISANHQNNDAEDLKHLEEDINAAKKILSDILQRNKQTIRREKFDGLRDSFNSYIRQFAEPIAFIIKRITIQSKSDNLLFSSHDNVLLFQFQCNYLYV